MNWMDFMMRILLAVLLGFLIGLERQITGHTAGIRINVLISMGSCLFLMFPIITGSDEVYRIASYIVSGVGFLCSGVIFKDGGTVRGLNTAATLWCTAAIGVLASSGYFLLASAATGTLILSNLLFRPLSMKVRPVTGWEESENSTVSRSPAGKPRKQTSVLSSLTGTPAGPCTSITWTAAMWWAIRWRSLRSTARSGTHRTRFWRGSCAGL